MNMTAFLLVYCEIIYCRGLFILWFSEEKKLWALKIMDFNIFWGVLLKFVVFSLTLSMAHSRNQQKSCPLKYNDFTLICCITGPAGFDPMNQAGPAPPLEPKPEDR